jgi:hypothetical protein
MACGKRTNEMFLTVYEYDSQEVTEDIRSHSACIPLVEDYTEPALHLDVS